jgi:hypothetical protein
LELYVGEVELVLECTYTYVLLPITEFNAPHEELIIHVIRLKPICELK